MKKKWPVLLVALLIVSGLYFIEISKIEVSGNPDMANLDELAYDKTAQAWEPFYRVRATLIDGQSAHFTIPNNLQNMVGKKMELTGAGVFYGNGCSRQGDTITVREFYLLPSLGLAQACVIEPDIEMRWTIRVILKENWILHRDDMINNMSTVKGRFCIDTLKPYEGVFFLKDATAHVFSKEYP
ncbi:hypothetical protein GF406_22400 [candidate division KSB1 bacterium]|nr:hypothetical protein [candidate division KSB1 bacterium]